MDPAEQRIYLGVKVGGRYLIKSHIGSGNFSGVFQAVDEQTGREVAVKILSLRSTNSPEASLEFEGEQALLGLLSRSTHVVRLLDHGTHHLELVASSGGSPVDIAVPYLVLELADASLSELLLRRSRLPWQARLELFRDIVKGVHQMHLGEVVHRDIKSDNGLVFSAPQAAKIADLGRSKNTREPSRFIAEAYIAGRGDLRFAPPELLWLCGTEDPEDMAKVDLFLLGSLLFEFATAVGITGLVFADPRAIHSAVAGLPLAARQADLKSRRNELRQQFLPAYDLFASEVPPHLRGEALGLLRQLTDSDPNNRVPGYRRPTLSAWDLQWVLRRADILLKLERYQTGRRTVGGRAKRAKKSIGVKR